MNRGEKESREINMVNKHHDLIVGFEQCVFISEKETKAFHSISHHLNKSYDESMILENNCFKDNYSKDLSLENPVCCSSSNL